MQFRQGASRYLWVASLFSQPGVFKKYLVNSLLCCCQQPSCHHFQWEKYHCSARIIIFGLKSTWSAQRIFTERVLSITVRFEGEILKEKTEQQMKDNINWFNLDIHSLISQTSMVFFNATWTFAQCVQLHNALFFFKVLWFERKKRKKKPSYLRDILQAIYSSEIIVVRHLAENAGICPNVL